MKDNKIKIEYVDVNDIRQYKNNPRQITQKGIDAVANSIIAFGIKQPLVIDSKNVIIVGHTRFLAIQKINNENKNAIKKVPCIRAEDLSKKEVEAYRLADNKTNEFSLWDDDLLAIELDKLEDFKMEDFGFDLTEISEEKEVVDVEPEEVDDIEVNVQDHDIWQLGEHRLMCGDSTKAEDVAELVGGGYKADLMITDPPYNVNFEKKAKEVLKNNRYTKISNDNLSIEGFGEFLGKVFNNAFENLKENASYYVFSCQGGDQELMMMMMMREAKIPCRHQIIWVKDAPVFSMGRLDYDYKHEPILYGWIKKHNFYKKGDKLNSVWEYKRTENKLHPTMKPIELISNAIKNSSKKGDMVLDLFGGSGSTLIACEQLNRKCYMMEIDKKYCQVIINRWEKLTGKKAEKIN